MTQLEKTIRKTMAPLLSVKNGEVVLSTEPATKFDPPVDLSKFLCVINKMGTEMLSKDFVKFDDEGFPVYKGN